MLTRHSSKMVVLLIAACLSCIYVSHCYAAEADDWETFSKDTYKIDYSKSSPLMEKEDNLNLPNGKKVKILTHGQKLNGLSGLVFVETVRNFEETDISRKSDFLNKYTCEEIKSGPEETAGNIYSYAMTAKNCSLAGAPIKITLHARGFLTPKADYLAAFYSSSSTDPADNKNAQHFLNSLELK